MSISPLTVVNPTANVTVLRISTTEYLLFSYETLVYAKIRGISYKDSYKYSSTTSRHIYKYGSNRDTVEVPQEKLQMLAQSRIAEGYLNACEALYVD